MKWNLEEVKGKALVDVDNVSKNNSGIIFNGDSVDRFFYFADSVNRSAGRVNNTYMYNYDSKNPNRKAYYYIDINGFTFVFLGNESLSSKDRAYISSDQINWLDEKYLYPTAKYKKKQHMEMDQEQLCLLMVV